MVIRLAVTVALLVWATLGTSALAEKRIALVIGNSDYRLISPLANPKNDAKLMASTLKEVGFEVIVATDVDNRGMARAVKKFGNALRGAGKEAVGLFYYAGHGAQSRGKNFLIPLNAEIATEFDLDIEAISASQILGQMEAAGNALNLVILDACRNNPFRTGFRSANRGFARVRAPSGSLVAFSAAPGEVAVDGSGTNSPYTEALAKAIRKPGVLVEQMFKRVRVAVKSSTGNRQTPWEESSLLGDFYFVPPVTSSKEPGSSVTPLDKETVFWNSIKDSNRVGAFQEFLLRFPEGTFSGLARVRLRALKDEQKVAVGITPTGQDRVKSKEPIKLTLHDWTSHLISTRIMGEILKRADYNVEYVAADYIAQFAGLKTGDLHVAMEIWETTGRDAMNEAIATRKVENLGSSGMSAIEDWWYPTYVKDVCPGLPNWKALKNRDCALALRGRYLGGPATWGGHDDERIKALGLPLKVKRADSAAALIAELDAAYKKRKPILLWVYAPHWVPEKYKGEWVKFPEYTPECYKDPKWGTNPKMKYDCGKPAGPIWKVGWSGLRKKWPGAYRAIKAFKISNAEMGRMIMKVELNRLSVEDVVDHWIEKNTLQWKSWIN